MQTSQVRLQGYIQAFQKHKIPIDKALIKVVDFTKNATATAMKELMNLKDHPNGIFTFKNYITP